MTFALLGVRNGDSMTIVSGPIPMDKAIADFKTRTTNDLTAGHDGDQHGHLELYELRAARSHKLRQAHGVKVGAKIEAESEPEEHHKRPAHKFPAARH